MLYNNAKERDRATACWVRKRRILYIMYSFIRLGLIKLYIIWVRKYELRPGGGFIRWRMIKLYIIWVRKYELRPSGFIRWRMIKLYIIWFNKINFFPWFCTLGLIKL